MATDGGVDQWYDLPGFIRLTRAQKPGFNSPRAGFSEGKAVFPNGSLLVTGDPGQGSESGACPPQDPISVAEFTEAKNEQQSPRPWPLRLRGPEGNSVY